LSVTPGDIEMTEAKAGPPPQALHFLPTGKIFGRILYKERVKLRRGWYLLALFNLLAVARLYVETRHLFRMDHAEIVWYRTIELGHIYYESLRYLPLFSALILAVIQFLPEMRDERLRLSLHLPVRAHSIIFSHLLVGSVLLAALMALSAGGLVLVTRLYFPGEIVYSALMTSAPWFLAGLCAYLGTALAMLEPGLKLRIFNLLLSAGLLAPLLLKAVPGAYAPALPRLLLLPPLLLAAALLPAYHFRHRKAEV